MNSPSRWLKIYQCWEINIENVNFPGRITWKSLQVKTWVKLSKMLNFDFFMKMLTLSGHWIDWDGHEITRVFFPEKVRKIFHTDLYYLICSILKDNYSQTYIPFCRELLINSVFLTIFNKKCPENYFNSWILNKNCVYKDL